MFAWIIHAKSTFPDQCRGLAEGEGGRGEQTHPGRMLSPQDVPFPWRWALLPPPRPVLCGRAGDPSQHPKAGQGLHLVRGVPLPSWAQEWGSTPPSWFCPSHEVTTRRHHPTRSGGEDPHPVLPRSHRPQLKSQLPAARGLRGSRLHLPTCLLPRGLPGIN